MSAALLVLIGTPLLAAAPEWLATAARETLPTYDRRVPAVVLLDDEEVTVAQDGKLRRTQRLALRFLTREGCRDAAARAYYETDTDELRDLRAWMVAPAGAVYAYSSKETRDVARVENDVYNESRVRLIDASERAEVGAVFGWEASWEEKPTFAQDVWAPQGRLPVRLARYTLRLPPGWRAEGRLFNHAPVEPRVGGPLWAWELSDLPFLDEEPYAPPLSSLAPRLAVTYTPATDDVEHAPRAFSDWADVARWYQGLAEPQGTLVPPLVEKARALTANATTDIEKIRAITRFVQHLSSISIQIGLGRLRPHPAVDVLTKAYGDCKDKSTLTRALLAAVGVPAHLVLAVSGDPDFVREEWASPSQFNHCIVAVRPPAGFAATVELPHLGRLLFFDPMDPDTQLGDLPHHEQGGWALIAAPEGSLVRLPRRPLESRAQRRTVEATLAPDGTFSATVREESQGQSAAAERALWRDRAPDDYFKTIQRWLGSRAPGAVVRDVVPQDAASKDGSSDAFTLTLGLTVPAYTKTLPGGLTVLRPAILPWRGYADLTDTKRSLPVVIPDDTLVETTRIVLPAGWMVDELPEPVKAEATFGSFEAETQVEGQELLFSRRLTLRRTTVPLAEYPQVREFFLQLRAAGNASAVLLAR